VLLAINRKIVKHIFVRWLLAGFLCAYFAGNAHACQGRTTSKQNTSKSKEHVSSHCQHTKSSHQHKPTKHHAEQYSQIAKKAHKLSACNSGCDGDCGNCHFFSPTITLNQPVFHYPLVTPVYHYHSHFQQIVIALNHPPPIYSLAS
jgi:hypothetical protein